MTGIHCAHCGDLHEPRMRFCPTTGRPVPFPGFAPSTAPAAYGVSAIPESSLARPPGPTYAQPPTHGAPYGPAPGSAETSWNRPPRDEDLLAMRSAKSARTLLAEAFELYQKHLGALLMTCAILLVPVSLAKTAALGLVLAPLAVVNTAADHSQELALRTRDLVRRQLQEKDPQKRQALVVEEQKTAAELAQSWHGTGRAAAGGVLAVLLGLFSFVLDAALVFGIAIPLTTAALTVMVADRFAGGHIRPAEAYKVLLGSLPQLISAGVPAAALVFFGLCLLFVPGLVLAFLFVFVTPVALLERTGGLLALKRSVALVQANIPQVVVVCLAFGLIRIVTGIVGHLLVPRGAFLVGSLIQDALLILLLPIPITGTVLLYLDVRRQTDGFDARGVRASIDALRNA